jgi:hypothetical protein
MVSIDEAARIALDLPEVTEGERHGHRTWFVSGKAFAWERPLSKADIKRFGDATPPAGPIRRAWPTWVRRRPAAAQAPAFTFRTDGYAAVLIQLKKVTKRPLREAIVDGWLACTDQAAWTSSRAGANPQANPLGFAGVRPDGVEGTR